VLTEASGQVEIDVPRDRAGTFEPQIVRKRQRRLNGVDEVVLSLYAKGLTTGEISAHFAEIYESPPIRTATKALDRPGYRTTATSLNTRCDTGGTKPTRADDTAACRMPLPRP
jgi:hypothetical protein